MPFAALPPPPSAVPLRVAIQGFGGFERQALESYFRLSSELGAAFEWVATIADSDCCVVDADHPLAVQAVQSADRVATSVFVGTRAPADAPVHLTRPLNALQIARALLALAHTLRPDARRAAAPAPPPAHPHRAIDLPEPQRRFDLDVLVVDDCDIARRYLQVQLQRYGCRVALAASAEQALERLARQPAHIVFADVVMPGLDGLTLCQRLKAAGRGAPTVALVSAHASQSDRVRAELAGCDAFLVKPLTGTALLAVLRHSGP